MSSLPALRCLTGRRDPGAEQDLPVEAQADEKGSCDGRHVRHRSVHC